MPSFPAFKTKPYYGALSDFLAVSIDLATGELKDSAVDAKLQTALANNENVVTAAADAAAAAVTPEVVTASIDALAVKDLGRVPLLQHINKARTGTFTVTHVGTSVAESTASPGRVLGSALQAVFGQPTGETIVVGGLGGSYTAAVDGWEKQPYGGLKFTRLRGAPGMSDLSRTLKRRGDRVTVEWSREADSGTSDVKIDGVVVGQIGGSGAQAYGVQTTFEVTQGQHEIAISAPASGYTYLEAIRVWTSTDTGVDVRNGALGGSSLYDAVTLRSPQSGQVAGIAISGNAGLDALFGRDDTDLMIAQFTLNDAGRGLAWAQGGYRTAMDYAVQATADRGVPMLVVIEMGGHYHDPLDPNHAAFVAIRDYLLGLRQHPHVTVLDWHGATAMDDLAAYVARYYAATGYNPATGAYTGDFTHPLIAGYTVAQTMACAAAGIAPPTSTLEPEVIDATRDITVPPRAGFGVLATVDGVAQVLTPVGVALTPLTQGIADKTQSLTVPAYRVPTAANPSHYTNVNASIAASATRDAYGPFITWNNANPFGLSTFANWGAGERMYLAIKAGGTLSIRPINGAIIYTADGEAMTAPTGTAHYRYVVSGDAPVMFVMEVGGVDHASFVVSATRVYEVALTKSDVPLLVLPPA